MIKEAENKTTILTNHMTEFFSYIILNSHDI